MKIYRNLFLVVLFLTIASMDLRPSPAWAQKKELNAPAADCAPDDSFEDNDTLGSAALITAGNYSPLVLCSSDPNDYFALEIPAGHTLTATLSFSSSNRLYAVNLFDPSGVLISGSTSETAQMTVAEAGVYYVGVNYSSGANNYSLQIQLSCANCITYQGRLEANNEPANGEYEFSFSLYDAAADGLLVSGPITRTVSVSNGVFSTHLYFGDTTDLYDAADLGQAPYLEIATRPAGVSASFTTLSPRQQLTPAPLAHTLRPGAVISGALPDDSVLNLQNSRGNGLAVDAYGRGLFVNSAGVDGLYVNSAGIDGVVVNSASDDGVVVNSAVDDGLYVGAAETGLHVSSAATGLSVDSASGDGIVVHSAQTGLRIHNAFSEGILLDQPNSDGVRVEDAAVALQVDSASTGVFILEANTGVDVYMANYDGIHIASAGYYAGDFRGNIQVTGSCNGCLIAAFGLNAGTRSLQPGDVVAVLGESESPFSETDVLFRVGSAAPGQPLLGVVQGYAEIVTDERVGREPVQKLVPRALPAEPGDFVSIIIYGPVQVNTSLAPGALAVGERLTVDEDGLARALERYEVATVNGSIWEAQEDVPTLGITLSEPGADSKVWVLVNPR